VTVVWIDGQYYDRDTAKISVFDHGLLYGDGVFEGIRAYSGRIFRLEQHVDRLFASAKAIWLEVPTTRAEVAGLVKEGLKRSGIADAYIRLVVTRGIGDLGLDARKCPRPTMFCITDTIKVYPPERYELGLTMVSAATPISHRENLSPRVKSLNYLAHVLAKVEASVAGADECVMLDTAGFVAEASGQNIGCVHRGVVKTPPAWAGILRGVTRDAVLELAQQAGYGVEETPLNRYDLYNADEVFLCGTATEVVGVRSVDGRTIGDGRTGPVTKDLFSRFRHLAQRGDSGRHDRRVPAGPQADRRGHRPAAWRNRALGRGAERHAPASTRAQHRANPPGDRGHG